MSEQKEKIGVVGLGYVGMPLAMAFAEQYEVVGIDASQRRLTELAAGRGLHWGVQCRRAASCDRAGID